MTLLVALKGIDGLVLAADSRSTIGDPRSLTAMNDGVVKIFQLGERCGIGISGAAELASKLVDELKIELESKKATEVDSILVHTRTLIRSRYDDWFPKFNINERPNINFIMVGLQPNNDNTFKARTYLLSSSTDFAPQLAVDGCMMAGVPQYAIYLKHRFYDSGMNVEQAARLAVYLISETATQDPKVGGPIRIAQITEKDGYIELDKNEVGKIIKTNDNQNKRLKRFFLEGVSNVKNKA
ncbi:MAG: hypothetical protein KJ077_10435 [Anaerolineae bacterium]|nr:hypothetical protein [Anaerolineae bacterium]